MFLSVTVKAHVNFGSKCGQHLITEEPLLLHVEEDFLSNSGRVLATTDAYPKLRITSDYSALVEGTTTFKNYVKTQLFPPVLDYFRAALAIKQPVTTPIKLSTSTICGFNTPSALKTGVTTDFYVLVSSTSDEANWVASAGACFLSSSTKRPLIAKMMFNLVYTEAAAGDVLTHERNMYLTMHEMMHALGFTGSSFKNFIDDNGDPLTGHIKTVLLNGVARTVLDVEPLTSKLRNHYGCSTLAGAFMEDDGGAGTEGSHFERRQFLYDTMTSGVIDGRRITEFDLAVLEGSGWYMPNYTYAEPFYFGKGEGCNFLYKNCSSSTFNYDDFCTGSGRGCSPVGRGGGICASDSRSDDCRYNIPNVDFDCESAAAEDNARFPSWEAYGRTAGSKCFEGNLSTLARSSYTTFCFKYVCSGSGLTTSLQIVIGTTKVTCPREGPLKLSGYYGQINCPDPLAFCGTVGKKYCPRGCLGRGTCVNNACVCKTGYTGVDCALSA